MEEPTTIGIDLAKTVFQLHGVDASGGAILKRKLRRGQVLEVRGGRRNSDQVLRWIA